MIRFIKSNTPRALRRAVYCISNESVPAIIEGLDVTPRDRVFAIAGSGDQAFALLEYVDKVLAVDNDPRQIKLLKHRVARLSRGSHEDFFYAPWHEEKPLRKARDAYFNAPSRLDRIACNLDRLSIKRADVFSVMEGMKSGTFNKFYLSNSLSYNVMRNWRSKIEILARPVPLNGLVYITELEHNTYWQALLEAEGFKIHERLTAVAREREKSYCAGLILDEAGVHSTIPWEPVVMERVVN